MKLVIDIPNEAYEEIPKIPFTQRDVLYTFTAWIKDGKPIPDDCEILTKEAYEDLCLRASKGG